MSQMAVKCPHCQGHFTADTADTGKVLVCPSCQKQLRAPTEAPKLDSSQAAPVIQINVNSPKRRKANSGAVVSLIKKHWGKLSPEGKIAVYAVAAPTILVGTCMLCICTGIAALMLDLGLHSDSYNRGWAGGNLRGELDRNDPDRDGPMNTTFAIAIHLNEFETGNCYLNEPGVRKDDSRVRESSQLVTGVRLRQWNLFTNTYEADEYTRGFERGYKRGYYGGFSW